MKILAIETSCDETGAAIIEDGQKILANVLSSSVKQFEEYGGIVPELAAREQIKAIIPVIDTAFKKAKITPQQIDAIAVTIGPGLIGSLLVGVETAKTIAYVLKKPIVPVNHLLGHIYANWLQTSLNPPKFPFVALVVSGGHTDLILMQNHSKYKWLGGTLDDAAGEAFDKVGRLLGLGYPGGPAIEKIAQTGNPNAYNFPRPLINSGKFDFSFSGLKTAVVNFVRNSPNLAKTSKHQLGLKADNKQVIADLAASFQQAVIDVLTLKTIKAAQKHGVREIVVGGGVAANSALRSQLTTQSAKLGINVKFPEINLAIDNGAMIAAAAYFNFKPQSPLKIQSQPGLYF